MGIFRKKETEKSKVDHSERDQWIPKDTTYHGLLKEYHRDLELLQSGSQDSYLYMNATFLAHALDYIDAVKASEAAYDDASIRKLEQYADFLSEENKKTPFTEEEMGHRTKMLAGYIGLVLQLHHDGKWAGVIADCPEFGPAMLLNGNYCFLMYKARLRIENGREDNLQDYFRVILLPSSSPNKAMYYI